MNKKRSIKNLIFAMAGQVVTILAGLVLTRLILISFGSATNGLARHLCRRCTGRSRRMIKRKSRGFLWRRSAITTEPAPCIWLAL